MITRSYILLLILLTFNQVPAQLYVRADNFTVRDGLSDNRIKSLMKDKTGFIWIGTNNGLNRYDGHSFRVFRPNWQNSISNEVINDIVADDSGYIWVATMDGLNRYDPHKDTWKLYQPDSPTGVPSNLIWDLYSDSIGRLWIVSDVKELTSYNLKSGVFTRYNWPDFAAAHPVLKQTSYRSIQKIVPGKPGLFYLGTNRGIVELNTNTATFTYLGGNYNQNVRDLQYDAVAGKAIVVTEDGVVYMYDEDTHTCKQVKPETTPYPSHRWEEPSIHDRWLSSPKGLINWRKSDNSLHLQPYIPQMEGNLHPGGITRVYEESSGVWWVGTPNGLSRIDRGEEMARFIPLIARSFTEGVNAMASVHYDPIDKCYMVAGGTEKKVFVVYVGGDIKVLDRDARGEPFSDCNAIEPDGLGGLWLLTEDEVYTYNRHQRSFTKMPSPPRGRTYNFREMAASPDGTLWFAAFSGGIWRYDPQKQHWDSPGANSNPYLQKPTALHYDTRRRRLWIGTFSNGLFSYTVEKGYEQHLPPNSTPQTTSPMGLVHDVICDSSGRVLVATEAGGIYVLSIDAQGRETWTQYSMRNGLQSNHMLSVAAGSNGEIWAISGHRVHHLDSRGQNILPLLNKRVMQISNHASDQRLPHSISYDSTHRQLIYASGGGVMIVPAVRNPAPTQFPLVISEINAGDGWRRIFDPDAEDYLDIPYQSNSLDISYAALQYQTGAAIRYQHRLWGYDRSWVDPGNQFRATYPNLPPGQYQFSIRALGPDGNVIRQSPYFKVTVIPPFWRTWWFILGITLVCLVALFWWIQTLRNNIRTQKILTYFATSLYGQNTVNDVFWDIAKNCVGKLNFVDCVIYQYDDDRQMLVQRAAYGPKSPSLHELINPLEIPLGKGIVGSVAQSGKAEIVKDTTKDSRYIVDDNNRYSEMAVPINVDGKLVGVIDSEHPRKGFYTSRHLKLMQRISEIGAAKISKYKIEERVRLKIARDLHDEMGSTLTSINIISKMALEQSSGQAGLSDQLRKIKDHSARMMDSMSDIVWAINPANDSFDKTILRMKEFAAEILEPAGMNYYFTEDERLAGLQLNIEKRKELYMLFKEAVTNAAKHSKASEVNILFRVSDDVLELTIVDNGNGFDVGKGHTGNGMRNMKNRAVQMKAEIRFESIRGTGTSIHVNIPLT